ncbi:uncharacterized protein LOC126576176 [Anopheles aquasalis]|uniref:uncharacterized protein LOC126576176 n=1 Tax=Anopheles aquasalis TaxID=42839 RepID=UPI00215B44F7|nr:uncharacterized protein LOC126576176 [Anopheles aquasalis]
MSTESERLQNRKEAVWSAFLYIVSYLRDKDFKDYPDLVETIDEELQRVHAEMHSFLPRFEELSGDSMCRKNLLHFYLSARSRLERIKYGLEAADKQAMPTSSTGLNNSAKPPAAKSLNTFYNGFLAQFRKIVSFESCPHLSRSERILRLIREFETAIVAARAVTARGGNLLIDELLVSLALSKLDEDTLTQVTQHRDPEIIPSWADFREQLLRLTTTVAPCVQS